jgi:hypothetical protein
MTRLLRAEALRLATTRSNWLLAAGATALIAGGTAATAAATSFTPGISPARSVLAIAGLAQTVALLAGVLAVTGEFRNKTITPAALITPRRTPLLAPSGRWAVGLGRILATGPGWRQSKRPARMRCSDAGRSSPGTSGVVGSVSRRR